MPDIKVSLLPAGTPAALADVLPIARSGSSLKLTVQEVLTAAGLLSSGAPAALADAILSVRSSAAQRLSVQDVLTALTLLASGAPAQAGDEILIQRSGAKKLLVSDIAAFIGARRNLVINPNYEVAQRAITYNLTTTVAYGSVDRWAVKMAGTAAGIAYQADGQAFGFVGFRNCLRLGRNSGSAQAGVISAQTAFETVDSERVQGKSMVLSVWLKAGANFSAASSALTVKLISGKGVDQSIASMEAGTWTSQASQLNVAQAITTTPTRYTIGVVTLPNDITQLGLQVSYTPTGTAGADDNVNITGWDLSEGIVAPPLEQRSYALEFEICRRYYRRFSADGANAGYLASGYCHSTTLCIVPFPLGQGMRAVPTNGSSAAADITLASNGSAGIALTALTVAEPNVQGANPYFNATVASGLAVGQCGLLTIAAGAGKYLDLSAEL
jgi:hypothetical protein